MEKEDCLHGGTKNGDADPFFSWQGGMMAQAARDPLWFACLTTALQDSIWAVGNPNAGDICIRWSASSSIDNPYNEKFRITEVILWNLTGCRAYPVMVIKMTNA